MTEFPVDGVVDAHVHLMPERLMAAIREALGEAAGWTFDHPTDRDRMETALTAAGVERYVALPYASRPGTAADLNEWVIEAAADSEMAVPFATVHAGDDDPGTVVADALDAGARGLKLQLPVQGFAADDPRLDPAYEAVAARDVPVLLHAGTAPMFEDSPHVGVERFESFLASYPDVRVCAAHMGTYEVDAFVELARDNGNVFLDTTFAMSSVAETYMEFDPATVADETLIELSESVMYGSDYPNIPYPYAREREHLLARDLPVEAQRNMFSRTARRFLDGD
ncbi:amidohydrolase family protein [Halorubrum ezzemoulense]|uniref:amidohydrolase family protein n=1 Tax=Halorubrum ezzemoulense TaxID=337243 RepID=UPI002330923D|nr:amidohydrolase family protein [Halorubrum ezzemoulense]MDB2260232.1 amidohydrolase family protein [Halorubrum ezzemoulense]MDB2267375.1 amidohydrolase family protein [Halorubrum ezzemoulense]